MKATLEPDGGHGVEGTPARPLSAVDDPGDVPDTVASANRLADRRS
ncbi:hypothetical protein ACU4GD_07945 [Cupriavidus basilensis]